MIGFDDFELDLHTGELRKGGHKVALQEQPFQVLALLLGNAGKLVTREQLRRELWPKGEHLDFDHSLNRSVNKLRNVLGDASEQPRFIETLPGRGYRFIGQIVQSKRPIPGYPAHPEAALGVDSPYYVVRDADELLLSSVNRQESVILLKGQRQTGKTSLLARSLDAARNNGCTVVSTDLQKLDSNQLAVSEAFVHYLGHDLSQQLGIAAAIEDVWNPRRGSGLNFDLFAKKAVSAVGNHLLWAIDEVDRILLAPFATEFFSILRAWHNERALLPDTAMAHLTVILAYAREAHLLISDVNQSPFNVGTRIELSDFTMNEARALNDAYGKPLPEAKLTELHKLTNGHPYLLHAALHAVATGRSTLRQICDTATGEKSVFKSHLRHMTASLSCNAELHAALSRFIRSGKIGRDAVYSLRSCGIFSSESEDIPRFRCPIYQAFLTGELQ